MMPNLYDRNRNDVSCFPQNLSKHCAVFFVFFSFGGFLGLYCSPLYFSLIMNMEVILTFSYLKLVICKHNVQIATLYFLTFFKKFLV